MSSEREIDRDTALRFLARALAVAFTDPENGRPLRTPWRDAAAAVRAAWEILLDDAASPTGPLAPAEVWPHPGDADGLVSWLTLDPALVDEAWTLVFGLVPGAVCPPYENEYLPWRDATHRAQHLADLAGFLRAHGVRVSGDLHERPDHVSVVLEFVALLLEKIDRLGGRDDEVARERRAVVRTSLERFLADHAVWWLPAFAEALDRRVEAVLAGRGDDAVAGALVALRGAAAALRAFATLLRVVFALEPRTERVFPRPDPAPPDDACLRCTEALSALDPPR